MSSVWGAGGDDWHNRILHFRHDDGEGDHRNLTKLKKGVVVWVRWWPRGDQFLGTCERPIERLPQSNH
jgi:hypothetical protein